MIFLNYLALVSFIYFGNTRPYLTRAKNNLELFNEQIILSMTLTLFCFTDWLADIDMQFIIGYYCIALITI